MEAAVRETVVLEATEADTALAAVGVSNNQHNSSGSVNGGSGQTINKLAVAVLAAEVVTTTAVTTAQWH